MHLTQKDEWTGTKNLVEANSFHYLVEDEPAESLALRALSAFSK